MFSFSKFILQAKDIDFSFYKILVRSHIRRRTLTYVRKEDKKKNINQGELIGKGNRVSGRSGVVVWCRSHLKISRIRYSTHLLSQKYYLLHSGFLP
jgi:hypothetical protein